MDSGFSPSSDVLYFRPRAHTRWRERKYLLWPAWMYRVVAPEARPRSLNILEKAVLGLARSGVRRAEAIGPRLDISPSLAGYVVVDLIDRGLLTEQGVPTQRGSELLNDELTDAAEMTVGHVFQDPFTGELWSRFVKRLDYAERDFGSGEYPILLLGATGKPHRERPFLHFPPRTASPSTPEAQAILHASRRHRARLRHSAEMELDPGSDFDEELDDGAAGSEVLHRISFVDELPKPVFLTTYLYLTEDRDDEVFHGGWYVCDPFGLGASPMLRSRIERGMQRSDKLREEIERLIGQPLKQREREQREFAEHLRVAAENEVEKRLTLGVRSWPGYVQLVELEWARQEAQLLGDHPPRHKLRALAAMTRQILEYSFGLLAEREPLGQVWRPLFQSASCGEQPLTEGAVIRAHYHRAAATLGFEVPIPQRLAGVLPTQVRAVCQEGDTWRLRPLIVASLLCAAGVEQQAHPLRRIASAHPRLLIELDQLAELGGAASHAGTADVTAARVYGAVDKTYWIVGLLSGLGA